MNTQTKAYVTELLTLAADRFPMLPAKPNLTVDDNGDVVLAVIIKQMWYTWVFNEEYEMSPSEVIEAFAKALLENGIDL